ncbi:hypothetical protein BGZ94_002560 [Podila epigama]|nr:hypothetical protein BGZ94_002560 [Podila epigama]
MAIPFQFPLLDESSNNRLIQSADSLDSALAQFSKLAASIEQPSVAGDLYQNGGGFDNWLAAEFQYDALLNTDDVSSLAPSPSTNVEESPLLELENFASNIGPNLFGGPSELNVPSLELAQPSMLASSVAVDQGASSMSISALQRAAAELNIPWSEELGQAYMARVKSIGSPSASIASPLVHAVSPLVPALEKPSSSSNPDSAQAVAAPAASASTDAAAAARKSLASPPAKSNSSNRSKRSASVDEESEEVLAKRAKNTDAARRSRLKKMVRLETLENKVQELEATNHRLSMRVAVLETEKNNFLIKDAEQVARIAQLEAKLVEAHLALTSR